MKELEHIRHISAHELAGLGVHDVAYIKPVLVNSVVAYAVHAADGTQIAVLPDRSLAFATVRQHDLEPLSVH
jgi:hypothetical protein